MTCEYYHQYCHIRSWKLVTLRGNEEKRQGSHIHELDPHRGVKDRSYISSELLLLKLKCMEVVKHNKEFLSRK